ncbi:unnamed protein product, partial [Symbiodinium pilosum]
LLLLWAQVLGCAVAVPGEDEHCALQLPVKQGDLPKVAIFLTTHWGKRHQSYVPCWDMATKTFPLLRNADLLLYTAKAVSEKDLRSFHFRNVSIKHYVNEGYQQGAMLANKEAFGYKGQRERWFEGYDWVVRLNPDTLLTQDEWILKAMQNKSLDAIFVRCAVGLRVHTDFFAVRPSEIDPAAMEKCTDVHRQAEDAFTCAVQNIIHSQRWVWLEGSRTYGGRVGGPQPTVPGSTQNSS